MKQRRKWTALLAFCLLLAGLAGCASRRQTRDSGQATLWVVTEVSPSDGMNYQAEEAVKRFGEAHENVTVNLEILPTEAQERENRLKQLRAMIPSGQGPDVYLLPTGNTILYTASRAEALFPDVTQAIYNGMFADISEYYDADEALAKEALNSTVMEAGVLDGARYVLPLRFDLPVLYTDPQRWAQWGLTQADFDAGVTALMAAGLEGESGRFSASLGLTDDLSLLPQTFDYEKSQLLLTQEELTDYMRLYQRWKCLNTAYLHDLQKMSGFQLIQGFNSGSIEDYIQIKQNWHTSGFPLHRGSLNGALMAACLAKVCGYEVTMLPLRTADGSVAAEVAYYGAVGSSCDCPELAYEFLRIFLTEEFQWDGCRPRMEKGPKGDVSKDPQCKGLVEASWPVRTVGSVAPLWENLQYQYLYYVEDLKKFPGQTNRCRNLQTVSLTDEDIPALTFAIDEVRFPIVQEEEESLSAALEKLNDENGAPTDVDIDALAEEVLRNLWWHLAEG